MIKIATVRQFTANVKFTTLNETGGQTPVSFKGTFKGLDLNEYKDLMKRSQDSDDGDALIVREVLLDWSGVQDEDGNELPFNEANRDALMAVLGCRAATVRTFINHLTGAQAGN